MNCTELNPYFISQAEKALEEGDALGFVFSAKSNQHALGLVFDNMLHLQSRGIYEEALIEAYTGTRTNWHHWDPSIIKWMFQKCDPGKLLAVGDPLPGKGPFRIYRGVSGKGKSRRLNGLSWTTDLSVACWFALRSSRVNPAILTTSIILNDVYAFTDARQEKEIITQPRSFERLPITQAEMQWFQSRRQKPSTTSVAQAA